MAKQQKPKKDTNIKISEESEPEDELRVSGLMLYEQSEESYQKDIDKLDKDLEKEKEK